MNEFIVIFLIFSLDDHTRAVLEDTNGFQDSDYINANYLAVSSLQKHSHHKYCLRYATLVLTYFNDVTSINKTRCKLCS
jgi:hypothetical protein